MDTTDEVLYSVDDHVATITINRPDRRNAINPDVVRGIADALGLLERDEKVRVAVLTGAGDRAFCAGGDLGTMGSTSKLSQHFVRAEVGELFEQMRSCRVPIVARVNGHALAGGFGLMLACDLVIAAAEAEMGTPEINLGLWPFMISAVIKRDMPRKIALELMMTGRRMSAEEAARWGIVNRVVPRAELDAAVRETTEVLASKSALIASLGKRSFYGIEDMSFDAALDHLAGMLTLTLESEDTIEGVTAFLEKRAPEWKDR
ncbi:MAG TPA: enoyl-CoA hydratase-related protein [Actinomycetota bacterium]|nr:enoyl-CoA hydratase-related protein [Actinomycetota bacterium]